jgi:hypothetical protein
MDPAKASVERLFHRRVRQVEPLLQKIDAQHTFDPDRRAAIAEGRDAFAASIRSQAFSDRAL